MYSQHFGTKTLLIVLIDWHEFKAVFNIISSYHSAQWTCRRVPGPKVILENSLSNSKWSALIGWFWAPGQNQPINALYFEFQIVFKFNNLEPWLSHTSTAIQYHCHWLLSHIVNEINRSRNQTQDLVTLSNAQEISLGFTVGSLQSRQPVVPPRLAQEVVGSIPAGSYHWPLFNGSNGFLAWRSVKRKLITAG